MGETKLREEICRLGCSLFERGLTPGSSGNISIRLDDGGWLVTPTNASLGSLDPARLSRLSADGRLVSGDTPTKEVPLHTALYQTRDAGMTVLIVEQRMAECLDIADRAYILQTGRLLMQGAAGDIKTNPDVRKAYLGL